MKKSLKNLSLNKKIISNLNQSQVKGGTGTITLAEDRTVLLSLDGLCRTNNCGGGTGGTGGGGTGGGGTYPLPTLSCAPTCPV